MKKNPLNRVLAVLIVILLLGIAAVTGAVFASRAASAGGAGTGAASAEEVGAGGAAEAASAAGAGGARMWTGLGRLRCPLKKGKNENTAPTAVLTVTFSYDRSDAAFTYELARNNTRFREEIRGLFAALDKPAFLLADEGSLKKTLIERFNAPLRLGKINALIFSDFVLID